ncbi:MAG: proton-conducting membrane transporter [Lachnospiraceae bacterium]|nr:proton-conducting membrane transporter [Lachnospiraceae bacterium]MBP3609343.1 proton-conducting membrane transporter [Lachnospiraceae bacterium]
MSALLLVPIVFPILAGALIPLLNFKERQKRTVYVITMAAINSLVIAGLCFVLPEETVFTIFRLTESMPICIQLDGMGRVFACLVAFLWPLACCYAVEYMKHEGKENTFFAYYLMTYGVTVGVSFAANLMTMYFFYEFLTLVTLPIVMHGMTKKSIYAGNKYVLYSIGGAAFAFMGMILLFVYTGTTDFKFGGIIGTVTEQQRNILLMMYLFAIFGFGVKAAIFPFHGWLPTASVAPTPVTALLHAVAVVNAGAFAIIRITYYSFGTEFLRGTWVQYVVMTAALITILYGSGMALKEQHFKRRLAYSTISNLSYMVFGASMMTAEGLVGAASHMIFHGLIKITLFYVAGAVLYKTGKNYVNDLFGYGKKMPVMFACFTLASAALVGVPPTVGFISKWNLITAAAATDVPLAWAGILVLLVSAVLTSIYLFSVVIKAYFPGPGFDAQKISQVEDPNGFMKVPMVLICVVIVLVGMYSTPVVSYLEQIAAGLI